MPQNKYIADWRYKSFKRKYPTRWHTAFQKWELKLLYEGLLPRLRETARQCGYGLGVHGSMQRDLDLIAIPWVEKPMKPITLARRLQKTACGASSKISWTKKPSGRISTSLFIGTQAYLDLSVMPKTEKTLLP